MAFLLLSNTDPSPTVNITCAVSTLKLLIVVLITGIVVLTILDQYSTLSLIWLTLCCH